MLTVRIFRVFSVVSPLHVTPRTLAAVLVIACAVLFPLAASPEDIDLRENRSPVFYGGVFSGTPRTGDFYGWSIAIGDIDGDGYADFVSSCANGEGPNDAYDHEYDAYLIFGRPSSEFDSLYAVDTPGVADIVFYRGGYGLAFADLDADGYDDLVLTERSGNPDPYEGGAYIVFGGPRSQLSSVYDFRHDGGAFTSPDVFVSGGANLGGAVTIDDDIIRALACGDLNNDGYDDIAIGDYTACDLPIGCAQGALYIVFGRSRSMFPPIIDVNTESPLPHPDVIIRGDMSDRYAFSLVIADLDGDGTDDLIAGTPAGDGQDLFNNRIGVIHGWWGKETWQPLYDTQIDEFDFAIQGRPGYRPGHRLAAGDLDGDGRDDLIVGSWLGRDFFDYYDRFRMGEYRVFFGRSRGEWPRWGDAINMTDVLIIGDQTGDVYTINGPFEFGVCMTMATGNRDADAYEDLMIGAGRMYRPDEATRPGGAYLIKGRQRSDWDPFIDLRDGYDMVIYGADADGSAGYQFDRAGFTVAMGDVTGNGLDELFIAAPFGDGPMNILPDPGEVYMIFDRASDPVVGGRPPSLARRAVLHQNYPNPFTSSTEILFEVPLQELASITVYDARGQLVASPMAPRQVHTRENIITWDGTDARGQRMPSGVYFVKLKTSSESHTRKAVLVR